MFRNLHMPDIYAMATTAPALIVGGMNDEHDLGPRDPTPRATMRSVAARLGLWRHLMLSGCPVPLVCGVGKRIVSLRSHH
jgi:hypothetical protein